MSAKKPYIAHGLSMLAWSMDFESEVGANDLAIWNDAMKQSQENDSRIVEQSNRIQMVHPANIRCQFCPPKLEEQKAPLKVEPPKPK